MEVKVLDSILHGELKPWKVDASNTRRFTELVKAAKAVSPATNAELQKQLTALLVDYPELQKLLAAESSSNAALKLLLFNIDLPACNNPVTHFYAAVITAETLRVYNSFMLQSVNWNDSIDIPYQCNKLLNSIKVLTQQTSAELQERGFVTVPDEQSDFIHFTLYFLKHSLIQLYFSVQESFKYKLTKVTTLEDFYSLDLVESFSNHVQLKYAADIAGQTTKEKKSRKEKLTFGFNGKKDKLRTVINSLCTQIELLKENVSPADMLIQILLSNDIKPGNVQIHLDCDNKNFRYVIEKFTPYFNSLSFVNIEHSKSFYSKKGTLLKANNFSKAKSFDPKEKATIDNIFKQMQ